MAHFNVLRIQKVKSIGSINGKDQHNDRTKEVPNVDKTKTHLNRVVVGDKNKTCVQYFEEKTKDIKIRKNAVYGIEIVMSINRKSDIWKSKELTEKWIESSVKWVQQEFKKENVVKVHFHADETAPHLHAFIVPMYNKKLNSKHYLGGSRYRLSAYQTSYAEQTKKDGLDLKRGIEGSQIKHQTLKKFYKAVDTEHERTLPLPRFFESKEKYRLKANEEYKKVTMKNLDLNLQIQRLQAQLKSKVVEKEKWEEDKKKTVLERELEKFNKQRDPNRNRTKDDKIKDLDLEMKLVRQELDREKMLKFLDKNPDIKNQIKDLIKSQTRDRKQHRDKGRGR